MTGPEFVESYRQRLDEIKQRADGAASELSQITATAHSSDHAVSVTVNPNGGLEDLQLGSAAEKMQASQLQKLIMDTSRKAQAEAGKKVEAAMQPLLGESEGMDFLRSQLAQPPQDEEQESSGGQARAEDDDDEGFKGFWR